VRGRILTFPWRKEKPRSEQSLELELEGVAAFPLLLLLSEAGEAGRERVRSD
jgi:hypothetical protein